MYKEFKMKLFVFTSIFLVLGSIGAILEAQEPFPNETGFETTQEKPSSLKLDYPLIPQRALEILDFWFGFLPSADFSPTTKFPLWFEDKNPNSDALVRHLFLEDVQKASKGEYNNWRETARGRLALILLLDQFPRRIYRGQKLAYSFDQTAFALAKEGIASGDTKKLYPVERAFFYLPLLHAENVKAQNLSLSEYTKLYREAPLPLKRLMTGFLRYASDKQHLVEQFGRFPERNKILRRQTTPEEETFLSTHKTNDKKG